MRGLMQIVIPMSGAGSRFTSAGYDKPKPFIEFHGKTMIENVIENLGVDNNFTLIVQQSHLDNFSHIFYNIKQRVSSLNTVSVKTITRGAAESCLLSKNFLNLDEPLLIANCDQIMKWDLARINSHMLDNSLDGVILTFDSQSPKNSYAAVDSNNLVTRTAEKQVISRHATNGIYIWKKAKDFFDAAEQMIAENNTVNNEFYVCPVYNYNIKNKKHIGIYYIDEHWPIGTPQDLTIFLDKHK